nr:retrotransposon Orf1 [Tanacetum cinerariifolium]
MKDATPFVLAPPNELRARITQELNELRAISGMIDSWFENIDHTHIIKPPSVPLEQLLNDLMNLPDVFETDDLESDNEYVDTPLISPFIDSDKELDDGEMLNELSEYRNARFFYHNRIINSIDGDDLAFPCMIGFRKFGAYFDPFLPMNIITRKAYNIIMVEGLESTGGNLVAIVRDVYVFVGSFTYVTDFVVLKDTGEFIIRDMSEVVMGRSFKSIT